MKIIVSQEDKKILVEFRWGKAVDTSTRLSVNPEPSRRIDKYSVDKAEDFLMCVDKIMRKDHTVNNKSFTKADLEFRGAGLLTERVIRAIIGGLDF